MLKITVNDVLGKMQIDLPNGKEVLVFKKPSVGGTVWVIEDMSVEDDKRFIPLANERMVWKILSVLAGNDEWALHQQDIVEWWQEDRTVGTLIENKDDFNNWLESKGE